ncbi:LysE family transporter [Flavobacterium sp. TMP13]|uniref:LysE family transporter n=1 Tax=Flavobacterium sp. TMP13 TaxID=3425950 RepID=UPI003D76D42F
MTLLVPLFLGFVTAFIGIIPPGLINMTAAKVNLKEGKKNAVSFVLGAVLVITFQVSLAIFFARSINARPDLVILLREIGFVIFTMLTIYFLGIAKKPKLKESKNNHRSKKRRFFLGMLLSALNFFPIPYYVFVSITLASYHLISFETNYITIFVSGAVLGSFVAFYTYIFLFRKIEKKTDSILENMNIIIGTITGVVAFLTLINIAKYYFE